MKTSVRPQLAVPASTKKNLGFQKMKFKFGCRGGEKIMLNPKNMRYSVGAEF
jgi:hypothetical protein